MQLTNDITEFWRTFLAKLDFSNYYTDGERVKQEEIDTAVKYLEEEYKESLKNQS